MSEALRVDLDERSGVPFYRQIIDRVMMAIADGRLKPGDRLPTVRQLAVDLSLNPNTVAKAYRDLEIVGVLETRRGDGTYVASKTPRVPDVERRRQLDRLCQQVIAQAVGLGFTREDLVDALAEIPPDREATPKGKALGRERSG